MATKKTASSPAKKSAPGPQRASAKAGAARSPAVKGTSAKPAARKAAASKAGGTKAPARKAAPAKAAPAKAVGAAKPAAKKAPAAKAKAPASKSSSPRSPFDAKFIEAQRELLVEEKATYERQAASYQAEAFALTEDREPGDVQFDEESGEGDTVAVERERDLALSAQARLMVEEIDAALKRIEAGTYGICRVSGEPIPKERLRAIPWATERVEYKAGGFGRR